jgi:hypothetical protein
MQTRHVLAKMIPYILAVCRRVFPDTPLAIAFWFSHDLK